MAAFLQLLLSFTTDKLGWYSTKPNNQQFFSKEHKVEK